MFVQFLWLPQWYSAEAEENVHNCRANPPTKGWRFQAAHCPKSHKPTNLKPSTHIQIPLWRHAQSNLTICLNVSGKGFATICHPAIYSNKLSCTFYDLTCIERYYKCGALELWRLNYKNNLTFTSSVKRWYNACLLFEWCQSETRRKCLLKCLFSKCNAIHL